VENVYIAYNFSYFAIYLPKLIKIHFKFDKVLTVTKMHSFLRHGVVSYSISNYRNCSHLPVTDGQIDRQTLSW